MRTDELVRVRREDILRIAAQYGAHNVRVFGSVARGDAAEESDIDLLVEMEQGRSLMDMGGMISDLEVLLGRRIDVAEPDTLHWFVRDRILREAVPL